VLAEIAGKEFAGFLFLTNFRLLFLSELRVLRARKSLTVMHLLRIAEDILSELKKLHSTASSVSDSRVALGKLGLISPSSPSSSHLATSFDALYQNELCQLDSSLVDLAERIEGVDLFFLFHAQSV
jgi:hypothetical protein